MRRLDSVAGWLVDNRRTVIVVILLVTALLGAGITRVERETSFQEFVGGTETSAENEYVEANFRTGPENTTAALVIFKRGYHVVGPRDMIEQLRYQKRLLNDSRVAPTLADDAPPTGITNVVMFVMLQREDGVPADEVDPLPEDRPPVDAQLQPLEATRWADIPDHERDAIRALNEDASAPAGGVYAYAPKYYDSRFYQRAHATVIYVYQDDDLSNAALLRSQTRMRALADETFSESPEGEVQVYGAGVVNDEIERSTVDSLLLVGPIAALLALGVLLYTYRDPLDVLLALFGVAVVLVWTFGFMGWAGIAFNQLFVSVPVFLTGLSVDYSIHAFMRYREERASVDPQDPRTVFLGEDSGLEPAMRRAVGGVGAAFALVTLTTATGFAASVTSPARPLRQFGIIAAAGIVAALVVFGVLIPALKVELDAALEARGYDRRAPAFAAEEGRLHDGLERCVWLAERAPWAVVAVALLATAAGLAGATTVDTTFSQEELHVEATPNWTESLPEPFRPGDYHTRESLVFFRSNGFVSERNVVHVLVRGDVTDPDTLERIHAAETAAADSNATIDYGYDDVREVDVASDAIPNYRSPVTAMRAVSARNETFAETFAAADTDDDGIPDRNVTAVYDAFYAADPRAAATVLHRENGEYRALRLGIYTNSSRPNQLVAGEMRRTAAMVDESDGVRATATGRPMIRAAVQQQLFATILRSFALTLAVVLALLVVVYRVTRDSASLGAVTVIPVVFATAWILGTMAAFGLRFNVLTALITSFTIGLGVDYSIHVSERYVQELDRLESSTAALRASVFGTGGALLGSALTDVVGFGVLAFALLNPLQQFGLITAMTIVYAFIGSVVVLPSLLVLWTRHVRE